MKIIKMGASWCAPCRQLTKTMDAMDIKIPIDYIDIDTDSETPLLYGVRSIPTMLLIDDDNNLVRKLVGVASVEKIKEFIGEEE